MSMTAYELGKIEGLIIIPLIAVLYLARKIWLAYREKHPKPKSKLMNILSPDVVE